MNLYIMVGDLLKKVYKYSKEQEKEIDIENGYTQKQLDRVKSFEHFQIVLNDEQILSFFEEKKKKKCSICNTKLVWAKECSYIGIRHPNRSTIGDYSKAYKVTFKKYCPNCKKITD